eukprot:c14287_g3_i1 orf=2-190(-)
MSRLLRLPHAALTPCFIRRSISFFREIVGDTSASFSETCMQSQPDDQLQKLSCMIEQGGYNLN